MAIRGRYIDMAVPRTFPVFGIYGRKGPGPREDLRQIAFALDSCPDMQNDENRCWEIPWQP
jgi:hypothetical protein